MSGSGVVGGARQSTASTGSSFLEPGSSQLELSALSSTSFAASHSSAEHSGSAMEVDQAPTFDFAAALATLTASGYKFEVEAYEKVSDRTWEHINRWSRLEDDPSTSYSISYWGDGFTATTMVALAYHRSKPNHRSKPKAFLVFCAVRLNSAFKGKRGKNFLFPVLLMTSDEKLNGDFLHLSRGIGKMLVRMMLEWRFEHASDCMRVMAQSVIVNDRSWWLEKMNFREFADSPADKANLALMVAFAKSRNCYYTDTDDEIVNCLLDL
jgi:hypothetical protein